jgi:hypothetical protein
MKWKFFLQGQKKDELYGAITDEMLQLSLAYLVHE